MRNITFDYSLDGGASFASTNYTVACLTVHAYLMPEFESNGSTEPAMTATATECQKSTVRLNVDISISSKDLDPRNSASALNAFLFLQRWQCAPIRRIYNADVGTRANIDGYTHFDTNTNTNYLIIDKANAPDFEDMHTSTRDVRTFTFNCYTRNAITLT